MLSIILTWGVRISGILVTIALLMLCVMLWRTSLTELCGFDLVIHIFIDLALTLSAIVLDIFILSPSGIWSITIKL